MLNKLKTALVAAPLMVLSSVAFAIPIYDIDRVIGIGTVTGTLETDGTIGVLDSNNIIDWDLNLFDGDNNYNLISSNSSWLFLGDYFTASATDLNYDFSGSSNGFAIVRGDGFPFSYWCLSTPSQLCGGDSSESVGFNGFPSTTEREFYVGNLSVSGSASAVPEPTPIALLGAGIIAFGVQRRKKRK